MKSLQKSVLVLCLFTTSALTALHAQAAEEAQPFTTAQQVDLTHPAAAAGQRLGADPA